MLAYWILFLIPAIAALTTGTKFKVNRAGRARMTPAWLFVGALLVVMIGLRHQVGGDWYNYLGHLQHARNATLGVRRALKLLRTDAGPLMCETRARVIAGFCDVFDFAPVASIGSP